MGGKSFFASATIVERTNFDIYNLDVIQMKRRRGGYINRARKYSFSIENFSSGGILKGGIVESSVFFYPFSFLLFFIRITSFDEKGETRTRGSLRSLGTAPRYRI